MLYSCFLFLNTHSEKKKEKKKLRIYYNNYKMYIYFLQRQETRDKRQETRDQRQETRDKRPETRDQRQETRDICKYTSIYMYKDQYMRLFGRKMMKAYIFM